MVYDSDDSILPPDLDDNDRADERAYTEAVRRHSWAQGLEDRDTGYQLDPLPSFDDWFHAPFSAADDE